MKQLGTVFLICGVLVEVAAGGLVPMSDATSWNSAHNNSGCGRETIKQGGGAGRFYCFATD